MTNGDKIRQMSDEELARIIDAYVDLCQDCPAVEYCRTLKDRHCKTVLVDWLKQGVKDKQ